MKTEIFRILLISLGLTLLFELVFALFWGVRDKKDLLLIGLVNVLTNPIVVLIHSAARLRGDWNMTVVTAVLEIAAVLVEAWLLSSRSRAIRRPALLAACANLVSFSLGLLINNIV